MKQVQIGATGYRKGEYNYVFNRSSSITRAGRGRHNASKRLYRLYQRLAALRLAAHRESRQPTHQTDASFVDNQVPPPNEQARGQLLRVLASDSMRAALESHFGVKLAFQNCHRVALFRQLDQSYQDFISPTSQILNQSPELVDC